MTARLTPAEAARLGLTDPPPKRRTRKQATGPYLTRCRTCGETFTTVAGEDRHLKDTHHARYELVLS